MSYQAIARKWRPGTFEEIAGQSHVTRTLQNALRLNRIHHAFLFTGARGVGKTTAARTFARCLNCVNGPTPTPCGECASCREVPLGSSPDVTEIDGASNNSVEDVRELRDAVRYLPSRDKHRVYIIDEVHMLSLGAFNALLKTLEEPPAHVIFIFATTEPQKIPDTILSRVQRFDFKRIPESVVVGRLTLICEAEGIKIPESGMRLIARAGEGSMRDSQSLLDQVIAFGGDEVTVEQVADILGMVDRELLYEFLEGLVRGEPDRCIDVIAKVYDYGYELSQFTSETLELLRNAAFVVLSPRSRQHVDVAAEELARLEAICEGLTADTFARYFQAMLGIHDEVSRTSRPRLVLEMAVARLSAIRQLQPVDHLLARMEDLERRLRSGGNAPHPGPGRGSRQASGPAPRTASAAPAPRRGGRAPRSSQRQSGDPSKDADASDPAAARPRGQAARTQQRPEAPHPQQQRPQQQRPQQQRPETPKPAPQRGPEHLREADGDTVSGGPSRSGRGPSARGDSSNARVERDTPAPKPSPPSNNDPMAGQGPPPLGSRKVDPEPITASSPPVPASPSARLGSATVRKPETEAPAESELAPPEPPKRLPRDADEEERFDTLVRYLTHLPTLRYQRFARHLVFTKRSGHSLRLSIPPHSLARARPIADDPVVKRAVDVLFPGVSHIELRERADEAEGLTLKEDRIQRRAEHDRAIRAEVEADPKMQKVVELFGARLTKVKPLTYPEDS